VSDDNPEQKLIARFRWAAFGSNHVRRRIEMAEVGAATRNLREEITTREGLNRTKGRKGHRKSLHVIREHLLGENDEHPHQRPESNRHSQENLRFPMRWDHSSVCLSAGRTLTVLNVLPHKPERVCIS
jgi:hypothetical protein